MWDPIDWDLIRRLASPIGPQRSGGPSRCCASASTFPTPSKAAQSYLSQTPISSSMLWRCQTPTQRLLQQLPSQRQQLPACRACRPHLSLLYRSCSQLDNKTRHLLVAGSNFHHLPAIIGHIQSRPQAFMWEPTVRTVVASSCAADPCKMQPCMRSGPQHLASRGALYPTPSDVRLRHRITAFASALHEQLHFCQLSHHGGALQVSQQQQLPPQLPAPSQSAADLAEAFLSSLTDHVQERSPPSQPPGEHDPSRPPQHSPAVSDLRHSIAQPD